ncbi:MAG: phenylacetate--CoA ligase family protein [Selenomonadaceae bacterium]|nr:phenylacetate--CoA ligase family protein [Selenomonadaceae bacterium]
MTALQLERLQKIVAWAIDKSFFYRERFAAAQVTAADIKSLAAIRFLPFLGSKDIRSVDALDMLTLPLSSILRFNWMQEITGEITRFYAAGDIARNMEMLTRVLVAADINPASVVGLQGDLSDSRYLDIQYALEAVGATVVPLGTDYRHWLRIMELVGMDTLISTPQLIMQLIIQLQATGKNIVDYPLNKLLCLNTNSVQNPMQQHLQTRTQAKVYNLYAPPEIGFAGMLFQCEGKVGHHVQEDCYYPEIIAFNSDEPVLEDDRMGELVVTTLAAEAMPLIRYRTGQAVSRLSEPCSCGRSLVRIGTPFSFGY